MDCGQLETCIKQLTPHLPASSWESEEQTVKNPGHLFHACIRNPWRLYELQLKSADSGHLTQNVRMWAGYGANIYQAWE